MCSRTKYGLWNLRSSEKPRDLTTISELLWTQCLSNSEMVAAKLDRTEACVSVSEEIIWGVLQLTNFCREVILSNCYRKYLIFYIYCTTSQIYTYNLWGILYPINVQWSSTIYFYYIFPKKISCLQTYIWTEEMEYKDHYRWYNFDVYFHIFIYKFHHVYYPVTSLQHNMSSPQNVYKTGVCSIYGT